MPKTYRAVQVSRPGRLEVVQRELTAPPPGKVRIRVEACGVCHSDALTVEGLSPDVRFPRVPGHEAVGKIDALGEGVSAWKLGQRVGVGFLGGYCGRCTPCRRGDFVNCQNQPVSGVADDGGYAEVMIADERALAAVPAELAPADAAPLLCAGLTTYNALRNSPARPGDLVAVQGIGASGTWPSSSPTGWAFVWRPSPAVRKCSRWPGSWGRTITSIARAKTRPPLCRRSAGPASFLPPRRAAKPCRR